MPLLIPYDASGLDGKLRTVIDDIVARMQIWAGGIEGINAAQRLNEITEGISTLPTVLAGTILAYGGSTAPTGYLLCDGSAVSREVYANLYTVIGTTYGAGNGTTTFNVPDLRGRYIFCKAASGTGSTLGGTFGTKDHTHTISASGTHTHGAGSYATPSHDHGGLTGNDNDEEEICQFCGDGSTLTDVADTPHQHAISTQAAMSISGTSGTGGDHNHTGATGSNNPPSLVTQAIIKV